jgi:hypothetical protein
MLKIHSVCTVGAIQVFSTSNVSSFSSVYISLRNSELTIFYVSQISRYCTVVNCIGVVDSVVEPDPNPNPS